MPEPYCIVRHNQLDRVFFNELADTSQLLKSLQASVIQTAPTCLALLEDLYYLLYKKVLILEQPVPDTLHAMILEDLARQKGLAKLRSRTAGNRTETHIALWILTQDLLERLRGASWLQEATQLLQSLQDTPQGFADDTQEGPSPDRPSWEQDFWKGILSPKASNSLSQLAAAMKGDTGLAEQVDTLEELAFQAAPQQTGDASEKKTPSPEAVKETQEEATIQDAAVENFLSAALEALPHGQEGDSDTPDRAAEASADTPGSQSQEATESAPPASDSDRAASALKQAAKEARNRLTRITSGTWRSQGNAFLTPSQAGPDTRRILTEGPPDVSKNPVAVGIDMTAPYQSTSEKTPLKSAGIPHPAAASSPLPLPSKEAVRVQVRKKLDRLNAASLFDHASSQLDGLQNTLSHIGTDPQEMDSLPYDETLRLYKRTLDPQMVKFFNKVGQKREIAKQAQHRKKAHRDLPVDRIRPDDDLDSIIDDELLDLSIGIDAFENSFIDRFLHKSLLTQARVTRSARHKGPIILCYDGSGSMEGEKIMETKAHILAFIEVARRQKRRLITIQFASASEPLFIREIHPRQVHFSEVLELIDTFLKGGTDFEHPLREALKYLETDHFRNGDILFITDGICDIPEPFKRRFLASKADKKFHLYAVIIHGNTYEDYGDLSDIADEILEIRQRDLSDWNQRISERIFSI